MTPAHAAATLHQWAKNAKTPESRAVCEMAAIGMRNSAMCREVLEKSGKHELTIQYIRDDNGSEMFIVWTRGGPTIAANSLSDALAGLLDKVPVKATPCPP